MEAAQQTGIERITFKPLRRNRYRVLKGGVPTKDVVKKASIRSYRNRHYAQYRRKPRRLRVRLHLGKVPKTTRVLGNNIGSPFSYCPHCDSHNTESRNLSLPVARICTVCGKPYLLIK